MDRGRQHHRAVLRGVFLGIFLGAGAGIATVGAEPSPSVVPSVAVPPAVSPRPSPPATPDAAKQEEVRRRMEERKRAEQRERDLTVSEQEARWRIEQLPPNEREAFKRNLKVWRELSPEERQTVRQEADERMRIETEKAAEQLGLHLDHDQREVFDLRYKQERRKLERELQSRLEADRAHRLPQMLETLRHEFADRQITPAPNASATLSPKPSPTPTPTVKPSATPSVTPTPKLSVTATPVPLVSVPAASPFQ